MHNREPQRPGSPGGDTSESVEHRERARFSGRAPIHVTVPILGELPRLRTAATHAALCDVFRLGNDRFGFRLCHYALLNDEIRLIVEARDRMAMSRGMQGLLIRVSKQLNRLWGRKGKVFGDRYRERMLKTPLDVREALRDVLLAARGKRLRFQGRVDPFSSAAWFDGWNVKLPAPNQRGDEDVPPVVEPKTALLRLQWRKLGLLAPDGINNA